MPETERLTYHLTEDNGEWFFSFNEDGSDPVGPFAYRAIAETAIEIAIQQSVEQSVMTALFGEAA